ncbi:HAMP domain-containing sensor histidine kinase [Deinococcus sonorensis]|uniref:histidine kinase n=2 Tax=Deinococcus sonorensis TaxID=309891 RepID=A0AAU7UD62_9DEIO
MTVPVPLWPSRRVTDRLGWRELLLAAVPLVFTLVMLVFSFAPSLQLLQQPQHSWTGFPYQSMINKLYGYLLASQDPHTSPAQLNRLYQQALASLNNPNEYSDLADIERLGDARLAHIAELFRGRTPSALRAAVAEAEQLNAQAHQQINAQRWTYVQHLSRLRMQLLITALVTGLFSTALTVRALALWRRERRARDRQARQQQDLLEMASHELRRPLQTLLLASDLMREAGTHEQRQRFLNMIEDSAAQIASRSDLEQLDTVYRLMQLSPKPTDLGALLREFSGPRLQLSVPEQPLVWRVDPGRLRQIIENLVENALKYTDGRVQLILELHDAQPQIRVEDGGPGLTDEQLERAFEARVRFQPDRPGSGMGLAVARRLAQAHGGQLQLRRLPHGGTCAHLQLGVARVDAFRSPRTTLFG